MVDGRSARMWFLRSPPRRRPSPDDEAPERPTPFVVAGALLLGLLVLLLILLRRRSRQRGKVMVDSQPVARSLSSGGKGEPRPPCTPPYPPVSKAEAGKAQSGEGPRCRPCSVAPANAGQTAERISGDAENIPPHLRLGLSLEGVRTHVASLGADAVERANSAMPLYGEGGETPLLAPHDCLNGHVLQHAAAEAQARDGLTVCERMRRAGSEAVGPATVFVSWDPATPVAALLDALAQYVADVHRPDQPPPRFWVRGLSTRHATAAAAVAAPAPAAAAAPAPVAVVAAVAAAPPPEDVPWVGAIVAKLRSTVLVVASWDDAAHTLLPLAHAHCIHEAFHTQRCRGRYELAMAPRTRAAFELAVLDGAARPSPLP